MGFPCGRAEPKVEHLFCLCMDGKWETVIDRKKSRTSTKPQQLQQNSTPASNGVFAAIDDWKPSGAFAGDAPDGVLTHCLHHGRPLLTPCQISQAEVLQSMRMTMQTVPRSAASRENLMRVRRRMQMGM